MLLTPLQPGLRYRSHVPAIFRTPRLFSCHRSYGPAPVLWLVLQGAEQTGNDFTSHPDDGLIRRMHDHL